MHKLAVFVVWAALAVVGCSDGGPRKTDAGAGLGGGSGGMAGSGGAPNQGGAGGSSGTGGPVNDGGVVTDSSVVSTGGSGGTSGNGGSGGNAGAGGSGGSGPDPDDDDAGVDDEEPIDLDPGTDDPDGDGDSTWPPPPSDALRGLPTALAQGACGALTDCLRPTLLELTLGGADCVARTTAEIEDADFIFLQASIDGGRIVLDATAIEQCSADTRALGCDLLESRAPASCEQVLVGLVPVGEPCVLDDDCASGAYCDRSAACPGVCAALLPLGGSCSRPDMCQDGLRCLEGVCGSAALAGEDCEGGVAPTCHLGLLCLGADAETSTPGSCVDQDAIFVNGAGETCDAIAGSWCDDGLACVIEVDEVGGQAEINQVCRVRGASGAACKLSLVPQQCPSDEYCTADADPDFEGTCEPRPEQGEPCGAFNICAADHYCDQNSICRPLGRRLGAQCSVGQHCWSGRCVSGVCVAPQRCRVDGPACGDGTCDEDEDCGSCAEDCGACPPECGDLSCTGSETCESCPDDCGACPELCGNGTCADEESCETCAADCGACPAPYAACSGEGDCAPSASCELTTVDNLFPIPDASYGVCAAPCETAADCTGAESQRECSAQGECYLSCNSLLPLLPPYCPLGMSCIDDRCTWPR